MAAAIMIELITILLLTTGRTGNENVGYKKLLENVVGIVVENHCSRRKILFALGEVPAVLCNQGVGMNEYLTPWCNSLARRGAIS